MELIKEYLPINEVVKKIGPNWSVPDVIHLGATGQLPIFVVPHNWFAHVFGVGPLEYRYLEDDHKAIEECDPSLPPQIFETIAERKSLTPCTLSKPVQLFPETLQRLELSPFTPESKFIAPKPEDGGDFIRFEYRIDNCAGTDTSVSVERTSLIIYTNDLQKHLQNSLVVEDKPLGTRERASLYIMVAILAKLAKVDLTHPSAAATSIQHMADLMGKHIGLTTIENHIKKVPVELRAWTKPDSNT